MTFDFDSMVSQSRRFRARPADTKPVFAAIAVQFNHGQRAHNMTPKFS
jgi:hypothetical protein